MDYCVARWMLLPKHAISQKYYTKTKILFAVASRTSSNKSKNIYARQSYWSYRKRNVSVKYSSVKWVLTFASINKECVLIKMSRVGILKGLTQVEMRRCMHRVLIFMKLALESLYLPLFADSDLYTSQHASWNPEIDARMFQRVWGP